VADALPSCPCTNVTLALVNPLVPLDAPPGMQPSASARRRLPPFRDARALVQLFLVSRMPPALLLAYLRFLLSPLKTKPAGQLRSSG
jgi:hypothetical protein